MAQDIKGSNNINLLMPNGQFGSRYKGGADASQPRYIYTLFNPLTLNVYRKEDNSVLTYLDDDGYSIEPEHFIPIIPMALVNGALGIGTGFSTNVPCYNPRDLVRVLKTLLEGKDEPSADLVPWYFGFKGKIELNSQGKYVSRGIYNRIEPSKIRVTELPVGFWTEDFKIMLEEMLDAKDSVLKNYESNYGHQHVDFTLVFQSSSAVDALLQSDANGYTKLENMFKLVSSKLLGTSNMYLFNEKAQIKKYDTALDVIKAFYNIRLEYYEKRKMHQISKMRHDIDIRNNKIRFIKEVIARTIDVSSMKKVELEAVLQERAYMKHDDSFDYIIKIPIYNMTRDKMEEFENDITALMSALEALISKPTSVIWMEELNAFEAAYDKYEQLRLAKINDSQAAMKATKKSIKKK
jgi:DNA topoisomerase-2